MCVVFLQVSSEMTRARAQEHWEELVYIVLYNALLWDGVRELIFNTGWSIKVFYLDVTSRD